MRSSRIISWTGFGLFILAVLLLVPVVFAPTLAQYGLSLSGAGSWVIGVLALISSVLGFLAFRTPQGKVAAIGGLLLLLAILLVTPATTGTS